MTSKKLRIMVTQILYFFIVLLTGSTSWRAVRHHAPGAARHFGVEDVVLADEGTRAGEG